MQPIPQKVTNVTVWPYVEWPHSAGKGPYVPPVIENATGTYSVGTLTTHLFYNLDLDPASPAYPLHPNGKYHASVTTEDGHSLMTPWMFCLNTGQSPKYGRTIDAASATMMSDDSGSGDAPEQSLADGNYIDLAQLEDVQVSQSFKPPAIGEIELISNAKGELISTRVGTPHLMGFRVTGGVRSGRFHQGSRRISVVGKRVDNGDVVSYSNLVCVDASDPAVFLQSFPV